MEVIKSFNAIKIWTGIIFDFHTELSQSVIYAMYDLGLRPDPSHTDLLKWPISSGCTGKQAPSSEDGLYADKYGTRKHSSEDHDQHPIHNQLQKVKGFSDAQPRQTSLL